ncbi:MAG: acyltransferase [Crocinitomicaceae bacterium]|nr:acyltransferase [Crocinitomicaceae bacterium]
MPKSKRLHFKDIDAMRFFAFLPVYVYTILFLTRTENEGFHHELTMIFSFIKTSSLDFFFFTSAFLLTSLGLREYKYNQNFYLKGYLLRKIIRLGPLILIGLAFVFIVHPWILKILKLNAINAPASTGFFTFQQSYLDAFTKEQFVYIAVIWSAMTFLLFSLLWGFVLKFFKKSLPGIFIGLMIAGFAMRILTHYLELSIDFNILAFGIPIGFGGLLAKWVREENPVLNKIKTIPKKYVTPIYITGICIITGGYVISENFILVGLMPAFTCAFFGFLILDQTFGKNAPVKFRNNKVFSHLGKISYGLLVYQSMVNVLIVIGIDSLDFEISSASVKIAFALVGFVFSWIIADISYNFVEKPLHRLSREFKKA